MKSKINLYLFFILIYIYSPSIYAQNKKNLVVFEIGTGTWCYNCQGAAWGSEEMLETGHNIAVIEYHSSDTYENEESLYRVSNEFYNIVGYPTTFFDGNTFHVGGDVYASIYPTYLPFYYEQMGLESPIKLSIACNYQEGVYNITADLEKVADIENNIVVHCIITESNIPEIWYDSYDLDFVTRKMIPDKFGTQLDFSGNSNQQIEFSYPKEASWVHENIEIVVFVQDVETKEIYQAEKYSFWTPEHELALNMTKIIQPLSTCENSIQPRVLFANNGASDISDIKVEYSINDEVHEYNWSGLLKSKRGIEFDLPETAFTAIPESEFVVSLVAVNGTADFESENTNLAATFITPLEVDCSTIYIETKSDGYYGTYSYKIYNASGDVVFSKDSYSAPYTVFVDTAHLNINECYTFVMYDSYGDGMCPYGQGGPNDGYYQLRDADNQVFAEGCDIGHEAHVLFKYTDNSLGLIDNNNIHDIIVSPNPTNGLFQISSKTGLVKVEVFNSSGMLEKCFDSQLTTQISLDLNALPKGVYFLKVYNSKSISIEKLIIN